MSLPQLHPDNQHALSRCSLQGSAAISAGRRSCVASLSAAAAQSATRTSPASVHLSLRPPCSVFRFKHLCQLVPALSAMRLRRVLQGVSQQASACFVGQAGNPFMWGTGKSECTRCGSATGRFCRACLLVRYRFNHCQQWLPVWANVKLDDGSFLVIYPCLWR